jgi:hypothetical protein
MSETISEPLVAPAQSLNGATSLPAADQSTNASESDESSSPESLLLKDLNLNSDASLSLIEKLYDLVRRNESLEKLEAFFLDPAATSRINVNETLKNGDTLLCLCCNKGLESLVRTLVDKCAADINLARTLNSSGATSFSTITPTITITARRQSRLFSNASAKPSQGVRGDSPLCVCIKYGFDAIAEYLIERGADVCGGNGTPESARSADFERSPVQEAIRLNRANVVEKMFEHMFEKDDVNTIEWMLSKRYDILRQVLVAENLETLRVILPNIIENRRIDGEVLIHILNYLLMKSKIQERKEKVNQILEAVMDIGTMDDSSRTKFEIYNLDLLVRGFFATLKALFNTVGSDDSRTSVLSYRTSLFYFIIKYQKSMVNFQQFYPDIDSAFDFFYTKMKETGENVVKLVEYFITFYDTLISMNHIHLTSANVKHLLRLEHVKKLDILGDYLIHRSLIPLDLRDLVRIKIKDSMHTYNLYTINNLPILDQSCKEFLYYS